MEDPEYPRVLSPLTKGPITQFILEGKQVKSPDIPDIRAMYNGSRRDLEETSDFTINPDPVPYQPSNFMPHRFDQLDIGDTTMLSATVLKKVPVTRRHLDTFDMASPTGTKRGVILHTDRYQWDLAKALDGMSQRERLQAELEYMERLRGIKRRREVLPHRAQLDLLMGGKRMEFTERFDIQREIQKLRSLILPQNARDLFHGRGFTLPTEHNSVHPRRTLPPDIDNEELQDAVETFPSSKYTFDPETGRALPKWSKQGLADSSMFPKLNSKGYLLENFRVRKGEAIPVQTANPFTTSDEIPWTPLMSRQHTAMSPEQRPNSRSPLLHPYSPKRRPKNTSRESTDSMFLPASRGLILSPRGYGTGLSPRGYINYLN